MSAPELYTLKQVSQKCMGIGIPAIRHWIKIGKLKAGKIPGTNWYCVSEIDLVEFMLKHYYKTRKTVLKYRVKKLSAVDRKK